MISEKEYLELSKKMEQAAKYFSKHPEEWNKDPHYEEEYARISKEVLDYEEANKIGWAAEKQS